MKYRELVKNGSWVDKYNFNEKIKLMFAINKISLRKINIIQANEIVSKLPDSTIKYLLESENISIITNPHEMAEKLKVYEFECEEPPSKAYWKVKYAYETKRTVKVLYGNCNFTKVLQRYKYISIHNVTLDSEETLEECDFELEKALAVLITEPAYASIPNKHTMYIYLPT